MTEVEALKIGMTEGRMTEGRKLPKIKTTVGRKLPKGESYRRQKTTEGRKVPKEE